MPIPSVTQMQQSGQSPTALSSPVSTDLQRQLKALETPPSAKKKKPPIPKHLRNVFKPPSTLEDIEENAQAEDDETNDF